MRMAYSIKRGLLAAVAGCVLVATVGAAAAHAESAWWGLTSQPRPTYLKPDKTEGVAGQDEVQEITGTPASGGPYEGYLIFALEVEGKAVGKFWNQEAPNGALKVEPATAANIQKALEAAYGHGNVEVEGGPVGTAPVTVTSVNGEKSQPVAPIVYEPYDNLASYFGTGEAKVITDGKAGTSSGQTVVVTVANLGDAQMSASKVPVTISDTLPTDVEAYEVEAFERQQTGSSPLRCSVASVSCTFSGTMEPYQVIEMFISVNVVAGAKSGDNNVTVSGGQTGECKDVAPGQGAFVESLCLAEPNFQSEPHTFEVVPVPGTSVPAQSLRLPLTVSDEPMPFGVVQYEMQPEVEGGAPFGQAGGHPFQFTTTVVLNTGAETLAEKGKPFLGGSGGREFLVTQPAMAKNLTFKLPRGLIGNPTAFPQCTDKQFTTITNESGDSNECPADTVMGVAIVGIDTAPGGNGTGPVPIFNLVPEHGEPARFGFEVAKNPVILDTSVRTGEDYGVTVTTHDTTQTAAYLFSQVVFWGTPGSAAHRLSRGWECVNADRPVYQNGACAKLSQPGGQPFLAMGTSCAANPAVEPLVSEMEGDSWAAFGVESVNLNEQPIKYTFQGAAGGPLGLTGCNGLNFEPQVKEAVPDVKDAATPTGLTVDVHVPQDAALNPNGVAESAVKQIEVALPEGVTVNPGGADGLQACSEEQIGFLNKTGPNGEPLFTPDYPSCPDQSKIATATIHTPLLPNPLEGFVYLATPSINGELGANPFNSLISMYLVAEDPISGVLVKLPMHVSLSEAGQLTTTVENPELPFEDAELHFFGGSRAPLATPALCGTYTTNAVFTPWSGNAPVDSSAQFTIDSGPNGSSCFPSPRPFAPGFAAGTTNIQAGAFTPFTTTMSHPDGDQPLGRLSMKLPPGLLGVISSVKLCEERQANEGTCGPESLIGHTVVTAGLGSTPAVVARPGNVYITGPYEGAPYGLSIANPAETGPFDLEKGTPCDCVVVRAKIEVNPLTAALTVTSDPLPTILKGIPLQLQHVNVTVDRPGFTFNPTNCGHMAIEGTMSSSEGASAPVSTPFQATNCATLAFKPTFKVSTSGKTSRKNGASLDVKLSYPKGAFGKDANIRSVKVDLPKQLPSRLTTLQKACPDATFNANPGACPNGSRVGGATTTTPVLPGALSGPVYFVSHGGAKFPELVVVLQGDGVTVDLHGETFISKAGITSSTFRQVPDVPVSTFELKLPTGTYSALAANGNLCKSKLAMPTAFTAQNGLTIHQSTKIAVSGCPKAKKGAGPKK
jgi:hypothetical protein